MQCLRKDPTERPASARALREALRACTQVRPWTNDEATAWWRTFRSAAPASAATSAISGSDELTMTVDIGDRMTHTAIDITDHATAPAADKAVGAGAGASGSRTRR